ncbi:hypothetical protein EIN_187300 [Entamoeba invadens IP1]|uniref:hypothetical protein n=1 Tax=Entamoeba invadens IP1 TaxID=370355 RepID=UPI0002C3E71E|nr:hypothetical protein EIN_187300 [Entamoeba invadens IP1]ELP94263.1 hypothetical protein EIN_187300 [Entamoeba invadens IP1]|eukprot:XP_004261034.1 hypothetical protein EIN_187300 [Entamoeba invadens IP1]
MIVLFFCTFALSQYTCTTAETLDFPTASVDIAFGTSTPESIIDTDYVKKTVKGKYFKITTDVSKAIFLRVSTCKATTTIPTEIYIFQQCANDIASKKIAVSGIDDVCASHKDFPILNTYLQPAQTLYIFVKLEENNEVGTVSMFTQEINTDNSNRECDTARIVSALPYTDDAVLFSTGIQDEIQPVCFVQRTFSRWYKITGDGKAVVAHTCNYYTNFDSRLSVVEDVKLINGKCNDADCKVFADDGCGTEKKSTIIAFNTVANKVYYIGVSSVLKAEGQFQITIEHLDTSIPAVCTAALPIKNIPFSKSVTLGVNWPTTKSVCLGPGADVRGVYLTFTASHESEYVFSSCKSLDKDMETIGVGVEFISNCDKEECAMDNVTYGECGDNNYLVKSMKKGETVTLLTFCQDSTCTLSLNVYDKGVSHSTCENALTLSVSSTFNDFAVMNTTQLSYHGCDSVIKYDKGLWYRLIHVTEGQSEAFTIYATDYYHYAVGYIELSRGCMQIQCDGVFQGASTFLLTFDKKEQYIFVYGDGEQQVLQISIIKKEEDAYHKCSSPLQVMLPYTAVHTFDLTASHLICTNTNALSSFYKFDLADDAHVLLSTCYANTLIDTAMELTKGCFETPDTSECLYSCKAGLLCQNNDAEMDVDLQADKDYILNVYSESPLSTISQQYRITIISDTPAPESRCDQPIRINETQPHVTLQIYNQYSHDSNFGTYGNLRGNYYSIQTSVAKDVEVKTCSSSTTTNSVIIKMLNCSVTSDGVKYTSFPDNIIDVQKSSIKKCDKFGTYMLFTTEPNEPLLIFVGGENFIENGFINVDITLSDLEQSISSHQSGDDDDGLNGGQIFGIVVGVLIGVALVVAFVVILVFVVVYFVRRNKNYGTIE